MYKIKEKREHLGLTQLELAHRAEVSLAHLQNIENEVSSPTIDVLNRILKSLGYEQKVQRTPVSYEDLAKIGVPVATSKIKSLAIDWSEVKYLLKINYIKAVEHQETRVVDAIQAYLLALQTHYPAHYKKKLMKDKFIMKMVPKVINGHHIKLRRVAIALLSKMRMES